MLSRVLLAAVTVCTVLPAHTYALTIVTRGEAAQAAIADGYLAPFTAATGIAVRQDNWDSGIDTLRTKAAESGWDLVQVDADELAVGCADGTFDKLDWSAIGGKDHYQNMAVNECGIG